MGEPEVKSFHNTNIVEDVKKVLKVDTYDDESTKASKQSFDYRVYLDKTCSGVSSYSFTSTNDKLTKTSDSVDIEEYMKCESLEEFEGLKKKLEKNSTTPIFSENRCLEEELRVNKNELKIAKVQIDILEERLKSSRESIARLEKEKENISNNFGGASNEKYVEIEDIENLKSKNRRLLDQVSAKDSKLDELAYQLKKAEDVNTQNQRVIEENRKLLHEKNLSLESFDAENKLLQKELEMRENFECAKVTLENGDVQKSVLECKKLRETIVEKDKILHERNLYLESFNTKNARLQKEVEAREKDLDTAKQNLETIQNEHKNLLEDIRAKESSLRLQLESMLQMEKEKAVKDFALKDALQDDLRTVHAEKIELSKVIEVLRKNEAMEKGKILALQGDLKTLIAEKKDLSKIIEQLRKSEAMEKEKTVELQNNLKALQAERKDLSKEIETLRKDEALEKEKIVKRLEMENCLQNDLNKNLSDVNKRLAEKTSELRQKNVYFKVTHLILKCFVLKITIFQLQLNH